MSGVTSWATSLSKPLVCLVLLLYDKIWILMCFSVFGYSSLQLPMCLALTALVGLVWFGSRSLDVSGFWLNQLGLNLKLWQEDRRYWFGWQCGWLMCIQWVEPEFVSRLWLQQFSVIAVLTRQLLCLMYLRFFANAFNYHVMEVVVTYRLSLHLTGEKMASKLAWTNSSVVLGGWSHWMETGNSSALLQCNFLHHISLQNHCDIHTPPWNDYISKHQCSSTATMSPNPGQSPGIVRDGLTVGEPGMSG